MKAKKGSKAYKAKLSAAQKRSWAKRRENAAVDPIELGEKIAAKYRHETKAAPFAVTDEVVAESVGGATLKEIVTADRERDVQEIRDWINDAPTQEDRQRRKVAMMGVMYGTQSKFPGSLGDKVKQQWHEGTSSHRWDSGAGCQQSNIPKEGGDPSAKPYNPDAMFRSQPIHSDPVNHPLHYGGVDDPYEAIKVIEAWELGFCLGNTLKYIKRAGRKSSVTSLQDLRKARRYMDFEISRLEKEAIR